MDWLTWLTWIGTFLTIVALALAVKQLLDAKHQATMLTSISHSLSTRYLGEFPQYLDEIVKIISGAKQSITIVCDFPAYARFSNPQGWLRYRHALEQKIQEKVEVNVMCFDTTRRRKINDEQFPSEGWDSMRANPARRAKMDDFIGSLGLSETATSLSRQKFFELLENADHKMLSDTFAAATVQQTDVFISIYYWMADNERAVFAIPSYSAATAEYGFITSDSKLTSALADIQNRYQRTASSAAR